MKTLNTSNTKKFLFVALACALSITACKKGSGTGTDDEKREEQKNEAARKEAILSKLSGKTYSLVVIKNETTGENLMASTMFPACIADDTFTLSDNIFIDFNYSTSLCAGTAKTFKGTYNFKDNVTDSIRFSGIDESEAYKTKGIVKQEVYMVKTFDETSKTMILSFKLANGNEVTRQYTYK